MNIAISKTRKGFTLVELLVVIAIIVALAGMATPQIFKAMKRASMAQGIKNAKEVHAACVAFAIDFDGQFPNDETSEEVWEGGTGVTYSNDYFRQLFLARATESEEIFWVKNSPIANKNKPDNKIKESGKVQPSEVLRAGDCHWAYINDQTQLDSQNRPLILDGYPSRSQEFDPDTWDGKAIVVTIDGSASALRMRASDNKVLDGSKKDILSSQADAWDGDSTTDLLKQPESKK